MEKLYSLKWFSQILFLLVSGILFNTNPVYSQLALQNFSSAIGTTPPLGWTNTANLGTTDPNQKWEFDNNLDGVTGSGFSGNYAVLNSDSYGDGFTQNATLTSPVFSCVGLTNLNIQYSEQFRFFGGSSGTIELSIDGGTTWTNVLTRTSNTGYPNPAILSLISIPAANGQANVRIRFTYIGTFGYWWSIDNVQVLQKIPANIFSTASGGNWSLPSTWVGGVVPISIDNVTIANSAAVIIDNSVIVNNLTVGQGTSGVLNFDATTSRTLRINGNLSVANGGTFTPANGSIGRSITLNGNFTNAGTTDFSKTGTGLIMTGTTSQSISKSGSGVFLNGNTIRFLAISNNAGIVINTPINISSQINLAVGVVSNGGNLTFDNTVGGVVTSTVLVQIGAQSSFSAQPSIGGSAIYRLTYTFFTNTINAQQVEGFEIPVSRTIFSLTINNGLGVVLNGNLNLTGTGTPLTLTNGILHMGSNTITLTLPTANFSAPTSTSNSWVDGKTAITLNSASPVTRNFPVGGFSTGQSRTLVMNGLTNNASSNSIITVEEQNGSTNNSGVGISNISKIRRHFATVTGNTITNLDSVKINYGSDDLLSFNPLADRTIGFSSSASGPYNSIKTNANIGIIDIVSDQTLNLNLGYFALGVSVGNLPLIWVGGPTGNWGVPSNWSDGSVPTLGDNVVLNSAIVALQGGTPPYFANSLVIGMDARLNVAANSLQIGPNGGSNKQLITNGILNISGGSVTVNGNVLISSSATYNMTGGNLIIDGNNGISAAGSVAEGIDLLSFALNSTGNVNATNGTITIIDPPFVGLGNALNINASIGTGIRDFEFSTLQLGNGISNTVGPASTGFIVNTFAGFQIVKLGNVIVNSGSAQGRFLSSAISSADGTHTSGNLTVNAGSEARTVGSGFTIAGNLINNGTFTTSLSVLNALTLGNTLGLIPSGVPQIVSGNGIFRNNIIAPNASISNLTINNTTSVSINSTTFLSGTGTGTVSNNLNLENGILNVGSNILTLGTSTTNLGTISISGLGNIKGKLKRFISSSTGVYNFPVGGDSRRLASVNYTTAPTSAGSLTASFVETNPGNNGLPLVQGSINVNKASTTGYWDMIAADGLSGGTYSPTFYAKDFSGILDFTTLVLLKRANSLSPWTLQGNHVPSAGSISEPILRRTGITTGFSQFGLGADSVGNPLPLKLISFSGEQAKLSNELKWTTSSEIGIKTFVLERLIENSVFESIAERSANNKLIEFNYSFSDFTYNRNVIQNYYRLKIIEVNGHVEFSKTVSVINKDKKFSVNVGPNPSNGIFEIQINSSRNAEIQLEIYDVSGKRIFDNTSKAEHAFITKNLDLRDYPKGVYFLTVNNGVNVEFSKIILQ